MDIAGFLAVAVVVVVTPGPDMALVARNTLSAGRLSGLATSAGTCSGLLVHALAAVLGLSALVLASSRAFTFVKLLGAAYLVFLGLRTLLAAGRGDVLRGGSSARGLWAVYRQGVLTNVLNPKVAVFFLSLLPQFVEPGRGFTLRLLALAGLFIAMGLLWLTGYTRRSRAGLSAARGTSVGYQVERRTEPRADTKTAMDPKLASQCEPPGEGAGRAEQARSFGRHGQKEGLLRDAHPAACRGWAPVRWARWRTRRWPGWP